MYRVYDRFGNFYGAYKKREDAVSASKRIKGKIKYEWAP